jgi:hydroxypyruvate isomerase
MPRFAANLSMLYGEVPLIDRFAAAAADGFKAVEILFPYEHDAAALRAHADAAGVEIVLINTPPGDRERGERGMAALPGREQDFAASIATARDYARAFGCPRIHVMAGVTANIDPARCRATYIANLRQAAERAAADGITLLIEPINPRDVPGYYLNRQDHAHELRKAVGAANLKVQMDLYHCQIVEGDVAMKLQRYIAHVGHMQVAGVPERHEPSIGEVNYPYLFELIDRLGYQGWIGCEYRPKAGTSAGLGWVKRYL